MHLRNRKYKFELCKILILTLTIIISNSCSTQVRDDPSLTDFMKTGFLNNDYYQVLIYGTPAKEARGLVEKRDSAYNKAKKNMSHVPVNSLTEYLVNRKYLNKPAKGSPGNINLINVRLKLKKILQQYIKFGYISKEFYTEDYNAVIVYRFYKKGLKNEIGSIIISPVSKGK